MENETVQPISVEEELEQIARDTVYDPEKSTLWIPSSDGDTLRRIDRPIDPNAQHGSDDEDDPRSTVHAMVNTILVLCTIVAAGFLVWSSGIIQYFMR